jgi:SAM-dependent methyltransferase
MAPNPAIRYRTGKLRVLPFLRPRGWDSFVRSVRRNGKLLDVGCGNNSPFRMKQQRPDIYYVGLDVCDYHQQPRVSSWADEYRIVTSQEFASAIRSYPETFDAVISSHNLEHCEDPAAVLHAMLKALKRSGRLYLAFPCEESVSFPHRDPLNFFDDPSHTQPPNFKETVGTIGAEGCSIDFMAKRYRPVIPFLAGLVLEPVARLKKKNMPAGSTWALYGFETVIWASRPA